MSEQGDLSSFALPHLAGEERVKEELDLAAPANDTSGDGVWSTAPNTPTSHHRGNQDSKVPTSYERAILASDSKGAWHAEEGGGGGEGERRGQIPKHISTISGGGSGHYANVPQGYPRIPDVGASSGGGAYNIQGGPPEVISPSTHSPTRIHRGFMLNQAFDATKPADLPGSRGAASVITTPPYPQSSARTGAVLAESRPRARSIEEADKQRGNYVPSAAASEGVSSGVDRAKEGAASYCLSSLSSLIISQDGGVGRGPEEEEEEEEEAWFPSSRGRKLSDASTVSLPGSFQDPESIEDDGSITEDYYAYLMRSSTCYDIIPSSTKIVVFDTRLRVKKAFFALVANGLRAAPLWDCSLQAFVGMLTITDFINILRHHYKSPIVGMDELENQTIKEWRASEKKVASVKITLLQIEPTQSLYDAVKMLVEYKIHRLPVIDSLTGSALFILTHRKLLNFLYCQICLEVQQPSYMQKTVGELGIGTFKNIAVASPDTPIITALKIFHEKRISALPIVDASGQVVDIYAKFDVINLAAERTYNNLDVSLSQALIHRSQGFEGVQSCLSSESLFTIVQRLATTKVHRLVIVDSQRHVVGVVSLSDVLKFLVVTPHT